jgi:hypothetical protein
MSALEVLDQEPSLIVKFEDGELKIPFIIIYCQAFRKDLVYFEDLVLTAIAWQRILNGELIYRFIEVKEKPHMDNEIEKNREILVDMVEHYRMRNMYGIESADFWGGTQDADGYIKFTEPLIKNFKSRPFRPNDKPKEPEEFSNTADGICTYFPLEIGYCMPDQIEMHLLKAKCVARFPYEYNFIVFLESRRK